MAAAPIAELFSEPLYYYGMCCAPCHVRKTQGHTRKVGSRVSQTAPRPSHRASRPSTTQGTPSSNRRPSGAPMLGPTLEPGRLEDSVLARFAAYLEAGVLLLDRAGKARYANTP